MGNKYILGAGLSSLCYAWYNPEYTIIGEDIGGRLNKEFFKNIIYFHKTSETENFLKDVGIPYKVKTQIIKYLKDNEITSYITIEDKINIIKKKLDDDNFEVKDLNLSTSDYYISVLEFSMGDLITKLKEKVKIIAERIIRITDKEIITESSNYEYTNIVSTLPANIFWKIYHKPKQLELKSKPVTFVLCDKEPSMGENVNYDMIYVLDKNIKYTRISKKPGERDEKKILYEFTGEFSKDEVAKYLPVGSNILEYYIDKQAIIYTDKNNIAPKDILFVGRFAEFSHSLKTQDVLKQARWSYDLRHIFNRQASFTSRMNDFNTLDKIETKEQLTQLFILHLTEELGEILHEINYKKHKQRKEIDLTLLKDELIDTFKYVLNLLITWDIDAQELVKLFNNKSSIVEKRLEQEFKK